LEKNKIGSMAVDLAVEIHQRCRQGGILGADRANEGVVVYVTDTTKEKPMRTQRVTFIRSSDLFHGLHILWERFSEMSDFCWGTNSYSLVLLDLLLKEVEDVADDPEDACALNILKERIESLSHPDGAFYVDLES